MNIDLDIFPIEIPNKIYLLLSHPTASIIKAFYISKSMFILRSYDEPIGHIFIISWIINE